MKPGDLISPRGKFGMYIYDASGDHMELENFTLENSFALIIAGPFHSWTSNSKSYKIISTSGRIGWVLGRQVVVVNPVQIACSI